MVQPPNPWNSDQNCWVLTDTVDLMVAPARTDMMSLDSGHDSVPWSSGRSWGWDRSLKVQSDTAECFAAAVAHIDTTCSEAALD